MLKNRLVKMGFALMATAMIASGQSVAQAAEFRVGLVLDRGGKDDKSFNASAFRGASEAEKTLGVKVKTVEAPDDQAFETMLRSFAQKKFDLIISIGVGQASAVQKVASQFKDSKFVLVDAEVNLPNVRSILFEEHEGSFLMGYVASLASKSGKVGFIGGMDIPLIRRFQLGYEAGAKKANSSTKVVSNYIGVTSEAWNNPPKGRELALSQMDGGVDVIFSAAGASGAGLFDAIEERSKGVAAKRFAIGVDSNQNWVKPGLVLTSMIKRVDRAVLSSIQDTKSGTFSGGTQRLGLANQGIDYAIDQHNASILTPEMRKSLDAVRKEIVNGKVKVPDYYKNSRKG